VIQQTSRLFFVFIVLFAAVHLSAQSSSSELGIWVLTSNLKDSTIVDPDGNISVDFDENVGYGLSLNHYWTDFVSTELSAQKYGADVQIGVQNLPLSFDGGSLDVTSIAAIAQLHFNRTGRLHTYLGAGVARMSGDIDGGDLADPDADVDLESKITWTASAGANFNFTDRLALGAEVRYTPWSAKAKGDPDSEALDLDPLTYGAALKLRF
jgi:outer membrane protein W